MKRTLGIAIAVWALLRRDSIAFKLKTPRKFARNLVASMQRVNC